MLYLAVTNEVDRSLIVYRVFIDSSTSIILAGAKHRDYVTRTCIIDIDEHDACVLALKGTTLFKVANITRMEASIHKGACGEFNLIAEMQNLENVMHWWASPIHPVGLAKI